MTRLTRRRAFSLATIVFGWALAGCDRQQRLDEAPAAGDLTTTAARQIRLAPGPPLADREIRGPYADNAFAVSRGERLYGWYNCAGCHFNGGGGIGPPLMDETWIYGGEAVNIFRTILEGRPNGMPAYGGRIPEQQAWQIVAYVRALAGLSGSGLGPDLEPVAREPDEGSDEEADGRSEETAAP
jgi:cytochrome c oxidase cbb3-type subunit III